jgi:dUTPase
VKAKRIDKKSSGGTGVTTGDRPGHMRRRAQVMHMNLQRRNYIIARGRRVFELVFCCVDTVV